MSERSRSIQTPVANEIGLGLLGSCAVVAALLVVVQSWPYVTPFLHRFDIPPMEWNRLPYTIPYSAGLWIGLSCISFGDRKRLATTRKIIALVVAAYAFSGLAAAAALAWIDFAARDVNFALPAPLQQFVNAHFDGPSGLWVILLMLTPGALIAGIALSAASRSWNSHQLLHLEALPFLLLVATAGCAAFLFGSGSAERLSYAVSGLIDAADLGWIVLPVVALGSLAAWITLRWRGAITPPHHRSSSETENIGGTLSSATRTSILILVLLYIGITQTSAYVSRMAALVDARKAFASDILYAFFSSDGKLNITSTSPDGKLLEASGVVTGVPWADVSIVQYPEDRRYVVEVTRKPSRERWSVRQYHQTFDRGDATRRVADQYGIPYASADDATKIYPHIETQLRIGDVSFPGTGISLDLTSFAFVIPVVVFATLVLFGHWLSGLARGYHTGAELQWVLVDARDGSVGLVARIWLIAIAAGPWLLGLVFVEAMALTLRTKGLLNTPALEGAFTLYVGIVLVLLTISTKTAAQTLIELRRLSRHATRRAATTKA